MVRLRLRKPWTEVIEPPPPDLDFRQAFLNSWDRITEREFHTYPRSSKALVVSGPSV